MPSALGTLREIPMTEIEYDLETRGRKDYGDLNELKMSIAKHGLISPIAVYSLSDKPPYTLVAGCRRLLACKELHLNRISCRVYNHQLTDYEIKAIELYENVHRKDMTDTEKVSMTAELHNLMIKINGPKVGGTGHGIKETAKLLGKSVGSVANDLKLAKAMQDFPELELVNVANKTTALRVLERFNSAIQNKITEEIVKKEKLLPEIPLIESYILGDFLKNGLPSGIYGFLEVDPPYAIDLKNIRDSQNKAALEHDYEEIDKADYPQFLEKVIQECYRLANDNAWIVFWYGSEWYGLVTHILARTGFHVIPVPNIWKKGNMPGQSLSPDSVLGNSYEPFIYARKGNPKLRQMGRTNIFDFAPVPALQKVHPTERPKDLIRAIFNTFVWPGTQVVVPFAGSGNTLLVAEEHRCKAVGFDLSKNFRDNFVTRLVNERKASESSIKESQDAPEL